jgi:hypothetical protein
MENLTEDKISRDQLKSRQTQLRHELETGAAELNIVLSREAYLRETLLRIRGALETLNELLGHDDESVIGTLSTNRSP